jgi:type II secretory pathway pseudopilin PulG
MTGQLAQRALFPAGNRTAYSLLELLLAMSLLLGLLAVAWALLGTYRDAEQRGWRLATRMQTVHSARSWLEQDMSHLVSPPIDGNPAARPQSMMTSLEPAASSSEVAGVGKSIHFIGSSSGFSSTIAPSLDPLPFLEVLISGQPESRVQGASAAGGLSEGTEFDQAGNAMGLWPPHQLMVEYRLQLNELGSENTREESTEQWKLIRRELLDRRVWSEMQTDDLSGDLEPVLTGQDLYNRSESEAAEQPVVIKETQLEGLGNPRFFYSDGSGWTTSWNSRLTNQYPAAICLEFDLLELPVSRRIPPTAETQQDDPLAEIDSFPADNPIELTASDLTSADEGPLDSTAEGDGKSTRDVRIVVLINRAGSDGSRTPSNRIPDIENF